MAGTSLADLSVLLVDDHPYIRRALRGMLARMGVTAIFEAPDGDAAIATLRERSGVMDVIFCDLNMPGRDGIQLLRELAAAGSQNGVVIMSALDERLLAAAGSLARESGLRLLGARPKPLQAAEVQRFLAEAQLGRAGRKAEKLPSFAPDELNAAIAAGEIVPFVQPKVRLGSRRLEGVEALARWRHPEHGVLPPSTFITLAEENGLIEPLTEAMLAQAVRACGEWRRAGLSCNVSVNVSTGSLLRLELPELIAGMVAEAGLGPDDLILEITESRVATDALRSLDTVARLRVKGFGLSIDDFGTGYSSLQQLQRWPFTELKVDQAFVANAVHDRTARSILEASLELARRLGLKTVAEGVETADDWKLVAELGCDLAQGYFVAPPMPTAELPAWQKTWIGR